MIKILIGLGSNIEPEQHLQDAASSLRHMFKEVSFSHVYQSKAVGMDGDDFLNACCLLCHEGTHQSLVVSLKNLEDEHGRDRSEGSWKPRTLDLDVLMFDGKIVDDDLYVYGHIYFPASELVDLSPINTNKYAALSRLDLVL